MLTQNCILSEAYIIYIHIKKKIIIIILALYTYYIIYENEIKIKTIKMILFKIKEKSQKWKTSILFFTFYVETYKKNLGFIKSSTLL